MVKKTEDISEEKTAALMHSVHEFLDYAWDRDMVETKRQLMLLIEGFVSGELCDCIGISDRANVISIWVKIMALMDGFEKYREGLSFIRMVDLKN